MAWGTKTSATSLSAITTEQFFDQTPSLTPRELADVQVSVTFPASPTDNAVISVYTTLDDTTPTWDVTPLMQFQLANSPSPNVVSFTVMGVYKFRIGVTRSGTTDTLTSAAMSYRLDGVSA